MRILARLIVAASLVLCAGSAFAQTDPHANPHGAMAENPHGAVNPHGAANPHAAMAGHDAHGAPAAHGDDGHGGGHHEVHGAPPVNWTDMGYANKDVHGEKLKDGAEPMAPPLLLALINFAIFAGLLYWKAGPALSKYLANRHETIKSALEEAAKLQEEAKEKMAEYSTRIKDADAEVNALIEQIRKDAEAEREIIVAEAERQAERMRKDAEARIESEFLAARRQLEAEVIAKAAETAEKLLTAKVTPVDHNTLFTNFIADLKAGKVTEGKGGQA